MLLRFGCLNRCVVHQGHQIKVWVIDQLFSIKCHLGQVTYLKQVLTRKQRDKLSKNMNKKLYKWTIEAATNTAKMRMNWTSNFEKESASSREKKKGNVRFVQVVIRLEGPVDGTSVKRPFHTVKATNAQFGEVLECSL